MLIEFQDYRRLPQQQCQKLDAWISASIPVAQVIKDRATPDIVLSIGRQVGKNQISNQSP